MRSFAGMLAWPAIHRYSRSMRQQSRHECELAAQIEALETKLQVTEQLLSAYKKELSLMVGDASEEHGLQIDDQDCILLASSLWRAALYTAGPLARKLLTQDSGSKEAFHRILAERGVAGFASDMLKFVKANVDERDSNERAQRALLDAALARGGSEGQLAEQLISLMPAIDYDDDDSSS